MDYVITCETGTVVLVSAASEAEAEANWDAEVEAGNAERRISIGGMTRPASSADISRCVLMGHDYR
jgi:hypothetical protein